MATYYIKNAGNDALDGLSDANAWATIAELNSHALNSGDTVLFNRGDEWRERIYRTAQDGITLSAYGSGARPIITGRDVLPGWDTPANWTEITTMDVGYTSVFASVSLTANRRALRKTIDADGTVQSITVYHDGGAGNVILAIYENSMAAFLLFLSVLCVFSILTRNGTSDRVLSPHQISRGWSLLI